MAATAVAPVGAARTRPNRVRDGLTAIRPQWSVPALYRAIRAAVVVPALFALCSQVIGNPQMATFAAFGGFATLVLASFGGTRRDRFIAHLGLGVAGSVLVVIGTAVNSVTVLAALVTLPVVFCVLFVGVISANAASGATAALLAYVLPAASPGTISMIPSRLAGWWLASVAGTLSVMVLFAPSPTNRLRATAATTARALADHLDAARAGTPPAGVAGSVMRAKHNLLSAYTGVPYRPTGLTVADQALGNLVEALQWCATAVVEARGEGSGCAGVTGADRDRLIQSATVLRLSAELLEGEPAVGLEDQVEQLERLLSDDLDFLDGPVRDDPDTGLHQAFHSRLVAAATRSVALDVLIGARRLSAEQAQDVITRWWGQAGRSNGASPRHPLARAVGTLLGGHTSLRSIWFLNSARGAVSLAAAVAVAGVSNVQHGFWVVLGALSVLRTSAASTGATALRALAGTVAGFVIGAALITAIGSNTDALWAVLPVAVLVAAYTPGTAPFAVGQAAFTVTISVLYNLIVPVGWKVGEVRVEDVAIGAAISVLVGVMFWPRGATRVVAYDLADAFHAGGVYLVQATSWALGVRNEPPDGARTVISAGGRLDDALRGLLSEQGTQRVPKETLWRLVGGAVRLRLMAHGMARTRGGGHVTDAEARQMMGEAVRTAGRYDALAARLGRTEPTVAEELAALHLAPGVDEPTGLRVRWVGHHLEHLGRNLEELSEPAQQVARRLRAPWWT